MLFPLIGRLAITDYTIIVMVYIEFVFSSILALIPQRLINSISWLFAHLFTSSSSNVPGKDEPIETKLRAASTIHEMCEIFNVNIQDYLVRTEDDYILTVHRIPPTDGNNNGKVAYLHHGLLMCSDVWVCNIDRNKNLPFVLHDLGYDIWMGNNRGNKYSTAHISKPPRSPKFWDFSIDEFAYFDIPNTINYITNYCKVDQVVCIGFSQGSAQMFAALSIDEDLNNKVSQFIAIAPAMTPHGLHNRIADTIAKSSPKIMYLFFGRNIVLPSAIIWRRTCHPKLFNTLVDLSVLLLFNWTSKNITNRQKFVSYSKLYSTTSVKSIVHWFQILRSQKFQLFEEPDDMFNSLSKPYHIPVFPTRTNIRVPILLIYGGIDSLVDIDVMKSNLPSKRVFDIKVEEHEHLDLIWGHDVDTLVIDKVLKFIDFFTPHSSLKGNSSDIGLISPPRLEANATNGLNFLSLEFETKRALTEETINENNEFESITTNETYNEIEKSMNDDAAFEKELTNMRRENNLMDSELELSKTVSEVLK